MTTLRIAKKVANRHEEAFAEVKTLYGEIRSMGRTTLINALKIGDILYCDKPQGKTRLAKRLISEWWGKLEKETGLAQGMGTKYIQLFRHQKIILAAMRKDSNLGIVEALKLLPRKNADGAGRPHKKRTEATTAAVKVEALADGLPTTVTMQAAAPPANPFKIEMPWMQPPTETPDEPTATPTTAMPAEQHGATSPEDDEVAAASMAELVERVKTMYHATSVQPMLVAAGQDTTVNLRKGEILILIGD
jgi:hypothetical protein